MKNRTIHAVASQFGKLTACLILGAALLPQSARSDYASEALAGNPAAFWQLNETGDPSTGTLPAVDSTSNGLDGTYGAGALNGFHSILAPQPPTYPGFATGQGALYCIDQTSVVTLPVLDLSSNVVDTTIAMWINPASQPPADCGLLFDRSGGAATAGFGFQGQDTTLGLTRLGYNWNDAGGTWNWNSSLYPPLNVWSFVALVVETNRATVYLYYMDPNSGQPVLRSAVNNTTHSAVTWSGAGPRWLGGDSFDTVRIFPGSISGAAIYNAALSSADIVNLFAAGAGAAGFAPSITGQPISRYVLSGSPVQFSATGVGGTEPFTYQWQLDGTDINLLPNATNYTGINSNVLSILSASTVEEGTYRLSVSNSIGTTFSSDAILAIQGPSLVGQWFTNDSLADVSGYAPAGVHDGVPVGGGIYVFTNDVPTGKTGQSLLLSFESGIGINNSSTNDVGYTNTFDERINNAMTVACWAKGWPAGWEPFVSKFGENGLGWQLRQNGNNNLSPCWTVRGGGGTVTLGTGVYNNPDDLSATDFTFGDDGNWHFYVGTYDAASGEHHLYVDGVLGASVVSNNLYNLSPASHLAIGAREDTTGLIGQFFEGQFYDVRVYNYALSESEMLGLYGLVPPAISQHPRDAAVFEGAQARFTVNAAGTPPLNYQWQFNGTDVNLLPNATNYTGATSSVLTVLNVSAAEEGSYHVTVSSAQGIGTPVTSSDATLSIVEPAVVGRWFNGTSSLADASGYQPPTTHEAYAIFGTGGVANYAFTDDVPPGKTGQSLSLGGDTGMAIHNSSQLDSSYTNTFDALIQGQMTVAVWAKGYPNGWEPWVSKQGEGPGWQLRTDGSAEGNNQYPCWTIRGAGGTVTPPAVAVYGNPDDMATRTIGTGNDGAWHSYVGTYNAETGIRTLYVDGEVAATSTNNALYSLAPNSYLCIGARDTAVGNEFGSFFTGNIYDVQIFNYALTAEEVEALSALPDPVVLVEPPASLNAYAGGSAMISASVSGSDPLSTQWQFDGADLMNGSFNGAIISGANTPNLTIGNVTPQVAGAYRLVVTSPNGTVMSRVTTVTVETPQAPPSGNLVGQWLAGAASLAETSGYQPAGTHDGFGVAGAGTPSSNYAFTNDVPAQKTGQSLVLSGDTAIAITNSSAAYDLNYTNTFDETIANMTVLFWAKGWPGTWNPFVSKYGEAGLGWQLRRNGASAPCWTLRGTGGNEDMSGDITMSNDGQWHLYAGTFDGTTGVRNLYVDGVLRASQSGQFPYVMSPSTYLALGGRHDGGTFGNFFTGQLYGVRIYDTALTESQVNWFMPTNTAQLPLEFSAPPLLSNGDFVLNWANGTLQQATNAAGPWENSGATSPYTNDVTTAPQMFFRLTSP